MADCNLVLSLIGLRTTGLSRDCNDVIVVLGIGTCNTTHSAGGRYS